MVLYSSRVGERSPTLLIYGPTHCLRPPLRVPMRFSILKVQSLEDHDTPEAEKEFPSPSSDLSHSAHPLFLDGLYLLLFFLECVAYPSGHCSHGDDGEAHS